MRSESNLPKSNICRILVALFFIVATTVSAAEEPIPVLHHTCNSDSQCLHGGTCRYTETGQGTFLQCQCADGYSGSRCEHYCPLKCQHGGICRLSDKALMNEKANESDFVCRCKGYFTGRLCETPYENCNEGVRCYNKGKCQEQENDHHMIQRVCACPAGWTGSSCETPTSQDEAYGLEGAPMTQSSSRRKFLWVFFTFCSLLGIVFATAHRKKWRSRRWRYNSVTRRAVHDHAWLEHRDGILFRDLEEEINLKEMPKMTSKFRDTPEYMNVI